MRGTPIQRKRFTYIFYLYIKYYLKKSILHANVIMSSAVSSDPFRG